MGGIAKWLLHEDQKELFDILYADVLTIVFLILTALLLWPMGKAAMALHLSLGYWLFWIGLNLTAALLLMFQRMFRVDLYSNSDAYVISGLLVSGFLQAGWSAFAAATVQEFAAGASAWVAAALYFAGLLSCFVASAIVGAYYMGYIYKMVNLPLGFLSFALFGVWPAAGRALYGWFLDLAAWCANYVGLK